MEMLYNLYLTLSFQLWKLLISSLRDYLREPHVQIRKTYFIERGKKIEKRNIISTMFSFNLLESSSKALLNKFKFLIEVKFNANLMHESIKAMGGDSEVKWRNERGIFFFFCFFWLFMDVLSLNFFCLLLSLSLSRSPLLFLFSENFFPSSSTFTLDRFQILSFDCRKQSKIKIKVER